MRLPNAFQLHTHVPTAVRGSEGGCKGGNSSKGAVPTSGDGGSDGDRYGGDAVSGVGGGEGDVQAL